MVSAEIRCLYPLFQRNHFYHGLLDYPTKRILVKALLSHKDYDRTEWIKWAKR